MGRGMPKIGGEKWRIDLVGVWPHFTDEEANARYLSK